MNSDMIITLLGGLGMFLLGMQLMTDGLKLAAGQALRHILEHSTNTPLRAVTSGAIITSLVQSSSAVTVATIGFVNAGLLKLSQAVSVIYGSNVGTTMTGWLVALLGFHVNIQMMAMPAIALGMFLKIFSKNERFAAYGLALTGFGILFLGIDFLKSSFLGLESSIDMQALAGEGILHILTFLALGFVMTVLMQSSSAAMALTLTAAGSGLIPLNVAASMVIGANLGTTSTAMLAVIGATPNAKRAATSHVIFNLITGAVALLTLPIWLWVVSELGQFLQGDGTSHVATLLALFHTIFNVLGVLIMWPLTERMVAYLEKMFRVHEEDEAKAKYLDLTLIETPELAHQALQKELERVASLVRNMAEDAISTEASESERLKQERHVVNRLVDAIGAYIVQLRQIKLPEYLSPSFSNALASARYFTDVAKMSRKVDKSQSQISPELTPELYTQISEFRKDAVALLNMTAGELEKFDYTLAEQKLEKLTDAYNQIKMQLLHQGTAGRVPVRHVVETIEQIKQTENLVSDMIKGTTSLSRFSTLAESPVEEDEDDDQDDD